MIVRSIDATGDWLFGKGLEDYQTGRDAIGQEIKTRLQSFLGDCFFNLEAGINWFFILGAKNIPAVTVPVRTTILNTFGVTSLIQIDLTLDANRLLTITYSVNTIFGSIQNEQELTLTPSDTGLYLLETGDFILLESGGFIQLEED